MNRKGGILGTVIWVIVLIILITASIFYLKTSDSPNTDKSENIPDNEISFVSNNTSKNQSINRTTQ